LALPPISSRAPQLPAPQGASGARDVARKAFFDAALTKAGAAVPASAAQPTARAQARAVQPAVTRLKDETTVPPHPGRILRPGSIIDIKV
jgi:hypothetical protein